MLVVDDIPLVCRLISDALNSDPELQVIGTAANGLEAVRLTAELRPDVVTMDVAMPVLDGYAAVREIMRTNPTPILVVTGLPLYDQGLVGKMLAAGALEVVAKPEGGGREYARLREHVKVLARVRLRRPGERALTPPPAPRRTLSHRPEVVGIVASTGGPAALAALFAELPSDFHLPILVVQHIAAGFVHDLATWLDHTTPLAVRVARHGEGLMPSTAFLAPDSLHLEVHGGRIRLNDAPPELGQRPSGNRLLTSLAAGYGEKAVGVVLTGMGRDGAAGLARLRRAGGLALVQDEATSSIFGMPRAAIEEGGAEEVLGLPQLASRLRAIASASGRVGAG